MWFPSRAAQCLSPACTFTSSVLAPPANVGNQPILRIGTEELRYVTTARLQELLGLVHHLKRLAGKASRFVPIVTETSVDGAEGVQ